jgi:hypothetical protein
MLGGKPEGKRPLGKQGSTYHDNIRMNLKERGWEVVDCIHPPQDRNQWRALVNTAMHLRVP